MQLQPLLSAQIGINKGEPHHALKDALHIRRQDEICDPTTEGNASALQV